MNKYLLLILALSFQLSFAQRKPLGVGLPSFIDGKKIPGVVPVEGDFIYMAKTEVSNFQYKEYLFWLKKHNPEMYPAALPDTTAWRLSSIYNEPFVNYYFQHPAYKDFPVVNVSQQQAADYCKWLHGQLKITLKLNQSNIDSFIVRLPTEAEWINAARGGLPSSAIYPWEGEDIRIKKGKNVEMLRLNCNLSSSHPELNENNYNGFITTPVESYWPNGYGLYNMAGNVNEWLAEPGKSKGGSWSLPPYNARLDVSSYYEGNTAARPDIGFRYLIEVVSVKNNFTPVKMDKTYFKKQFVALPDSLKSKSKWACKTEVSNAEYQTFLNEVKDSAFAIKSSNWSAYFKYGYYQMYGVNNGFGNYPVVNITYEAAVAYCTWLTQKYNSINGRTYKQVKFRLPNNDEWELAASGGHKGFHFPWGGPYLRNSVGCYLANFSPLEDRFLYRKNSVLKYNYPDDDITISRGIDGAIIPSTVTSYFPNDIGLFNCSGNVSEMLNVKYQAKGGSWFSGYQTLLIRSNEIYTSENPLTGFRVFMEVVEK